MERNTAEVTINGKKVGFKCGTLAIAIACREAACPTVQDLMRRMASQDLLAVLALFYGSAVQYSGNKNLTMDEVSDYLDQMGEEKAGQVTNVLLE